jgi:hypothetical protein
MFSFSDVMKAPTDCWRIDEKFGPLYAGTEAKTQKGVTCQAWTATSPHSVTYIYKDPKNYPSDNYDISLANNYCR